jgi:CheY-like chemotaxis protein
MPVGWIPSRSDACRAADKAVIGLDPWEKLLADIVVSDLRMLQCDDRELCRRIRAEPTLKHVRVVIVTRLLVEADAQCSQPLDPVRIPERGAGHRQRTRPSVAGNRGRFKKSTVTAYGISQIAIDAVTRREQVELERRERLTATGGLLSNSTAAGPPCEELYVSVRSTGIDNNAGRCQRLHRIPIAQNDAVTPICFPRRDKRKPRQPSSSPMAPVMICIPIIRGMPEEGPHDPIYDPGGTEKREDKEDDLSHIRHGLFVALKGEREADGIVIQPTGLERRTRRSGTYNHAGRWDDRPPGARCQQHRLLQERPHRAAEAILHQNAGRRTSLAACGDR